MHLRTGRASNTIRSQCQVSRKGFLNIRTQQMISKSKPFGLAETVLIRIVEDICFQIITAG
jgi:hypothetical protein